MESILRLLVLPVFVCTCYSCTAILRPVLSLQFSQRGSGWNREHLDMEPHAGTPPLLPCITSAWRSSSRSTFKSCYSASTRGMRSAKFSHVDTSSLNNRLDGGQRSEREGRRAATRTSHCCAPDVLIEQDETDKPCLRTTRPVSQSMTVVSPRARICGGAPRTGHLTRVVAQVFPSQGH